MMVRNCMEIIVDNIINSVLVQYKDICKCEKCIEDIKAIALNNLKPLYVVTEKGNVYARLHELEIQFRTDVIKEIMAAIDIVSKNVQHNL